MPLAYDTCQGTHLNSPLTNESLIFLLCHIQEKEQPELANLTKNVLSHLPNLEQLQMNWRFKWEEVLMNPQCLISKLFNQTPELPMPERPSNTAFLRFLNLSIQNLKLQLPATEAHLFSLKLIPDDILTQVTRHRSYAQLVHLDSLRAILEQGVCLTAKASRQDRDHDLQTWTNWSAGQKDDDGLDNFYCDLKGRTRFWVDSEFFAMQTLSKQIWMGSRKHFLLFSDIISQRFLILLASVLAEILGLSNYPSVEILNDTFKWGDEILKAHGNEGYSLIKMWESLCTGVILSSEVDPAIDSCLFLKNMKDEFLSIQVGSKREREIHLVKSLKILLPLKRNKHLLTQLFGLFRIWGHPTVSLKEGLKKLRSVATVHREANPSMVRLVILKWREMLFLSFHKKHSVWPKFEFKPDQYNASSYLHQCLSKNLPLNLTVKQYDLGDWGAIKLLQNFNVADKFELSEMIADKATSFGYSDLLHSIEKKGTIGLAAERSVIIRWLKSNFNNPLEFLQKIDKEGFDPDSGPVGVCAKEQELSICPRFFGLLPLDKRLYVVLTEAMLADNLLPYFPEITMTYDSTTLLTKIYTQNKELHKNDSGSSLYKTVVVNIDFMKWNSFMRYSETLEMFQDFDHLFGFENVYARTHEMFSGQIYLAMNHYLPVVNKTEQKLWDSEIVWSDHLGGIEGLRQKGWTIFTTVILKMVSELTGVECTTMGQGDNQVFLCKYRVKEDQSVADQHAHFLKTLDKILEQIGPPLKPLETWSSSNFFIYGKYPLWKGVPLSMSLKKICRCMRLTNDGLQNIHSTLSSIAANAAAATYSDNSPIVPYLIATMESAAALQLSIENPFYKSQPLNSAMISGHATLSLPQDGIAQRMHLTIRGSLKNMVTKVDDDFLTILLNYPSILGGYPILMWNELIVHGFPDPLTLAINSIINCRNNTKKGHLKMFFEKIMNPQLNDSVNSEMICTDPFSINLLQGSTASDKVKRMVFDFLSSQVSKEIYTNKVFIEFLQLAKTEQKDLCNILYNLEPFNPLVASSIIESTPVGRANKMMSKVNKTNVLIKLMLSDRNKTALIESLEAEGAEIFDIRDPTRPKPTFYQLFGRFEENYLHGMMMNLSFATSVTEEKKVICSFKQATLLREKSWKKHIEGVTTAFPMEMFKSYVEGTKPEDSQLTSLGFFQTQIIGRESLNQSCNEELGPFKPYFGSTTKNKVTYEAKKLVPAAPPLLKNVLELLCIPGWITPIGSKLDELIRMIFSSVTDLDVDSLVPAEDEIAGSFNHRKDSERAKMRSTISILWKWASYIISTSDHYKPELKDSTWETDNLAINYQSIYLTLSFLLSLKLEKEGLPLDTLTIRWYTGCLDCIQPVNETQITLPEDTDLSNITSLKQHTNNPYCWVSGDSVLQSTKEQESLGPRVSLPNLDKSFLEHLLSLGISQSVISMNYVVNQFNQSSSSIDSIIQTVPLGVCLKANLVEVLESLADDLILKYMFYSLPNQWFSRKEFSRWILSVLESVQSISSHWFYSLKNFYSSSTAINNFQIRFPNVRLPEGSPPNKVQIGISFQKAISSIIQQPTYLDTLYNRLIYRIKIPYSISPAGYLHPVFIANVLAIIKERKIETNNMVMIPFFEYYRTRVAILPSTMKIPAWDDLKLTTSDDLRSYYLWAQKVRSWNMTFLQYTVSALSERLSKRIRPNQDMLIPQESHSLYPLMKHLEQLKSTCTLLIEVTEKELSYSARKETNNYAFVEFSPGEKIYPDEHYYKITPTSTSALYKLISVLQFISEDLVSVLSNPDRTLCCTADGSGGFSAVLMKIFPESKVIYNTLRSFSDQNPDGTGFIYPSSLSQFHIHPDSVLGLRLLECDISDLEKKRTWEKLSKLSQDVDILTCDAEGSGWNDPLKAVNIAKGFALFGFVKDVKVAILKGYMSNPLTSFYIVNVLLSCFQKVKVIRTHFSSRGNTEVYYIATLVREKSLRFPVYETSDKSGEITGLLSRESYELYLEATTGTPSIYFKSSLDTSFEYTRFIERINPNLSIQPELINIIRKMKMSSGNRILNYPGSWIKTLREKYPLIRFTGYNPKNNRRSTLTRAVQREILTELLITSALCYSVGERKGLLLRVFENGDKWWFFCSQSFDGNYTTGLKYGKNYPSFSLEVSHQVSELLNVRSYQRIFSELGKMEFAHPNLKLTARFSPLTETWSYVDVLRVLAGREEGQLNYPLWAAPIKSFWELPPELIESFGLLREMTLWDEYRILPFEVSLAQAYKLKGVTLENAKIMKKFYMGILLQQINGNPR